MGKIEMRFLIHGDREKAERFGQFFEKVARLLSGDPNIIAAFEDGYEEACARTVAAEIGLRFMDEQSPEYAAAEISQTVKRLHTQAVCEEKVEEMKNLMNAPVSTIH